MKKLLIAAALTGGLMLAGCGTTGTTGAPLMTSQGTFAALSPSGAVTGFRMCFSTSASACGGSINISSGTIEVYGNP